MAEFNLEKYLTPLSPDLPCGENLEDDMIFAQLEDAAKFIGERQMGTTIIPASEPDWRKVREFALELLSRSRDLQVVLHLTSAEIRLSGFAGLAKSLKLIDGLLEKYWDDVYPRQDPEDDYPILRINTLNNLKDNKKILEGIAKAKLTQSKIGAFSWYDVEVSQGKLTPPEGVEAVDMALIEAALLDTPLEFLQTIRTALQEILTASKNIMSVTADRCGAMNVPELGPFINLMKNISNWLSEKIKLRPDQANIAPAQDVSGEIISDGPEPALAPVRVGSIQNREDVVKVLDALCNYFERYEPSSPIPLLLLRAKKLLPMNFMDILRELAPDAINQAETVCGSRKDN